MLNIKLLGHTTITYKGKNITNDFSRKNIALLFLLIVNDKKYVTRDKIALYLWPESNEESSKYNVRYNLWMLSKSLPKDSKGNELIIIDKNSCTINNDYNYECDLLSIMNCNVNDDNIDLLSSIVDSSFSGDVMEGWFINHCYEFNELILLYRMQLERKQLEILEKLSISYFTKQKYDKVLNTLKKAEIFDSTSETVAAGIMKAYCVTNDRVSGINYYKDFEARLWKDLQILPNEELQKMYENLASRNIAVSENSNSEEEVRAIEIYGFGIESIEWSLVSCIIDSLVKNTYDMVIENLESDIVAELSYINKKLLIKYNKLTASNITSPADLSPIRIMQAFSNMLESVSEYSKIVIEIDSFESADKTSQDVIYYIEKVHKEIKIVK